jgi:hypothetical protein
LLIEKPVKLIKVFRFVKPVSAEPRNAPKADARGEGSRRLSACKVLWSFVCVPLVPRKGARSMMSIGRTGSVRQRQMEWAEIVVRVPKSCVEEAEELGLLDPESLADLLREALDERIMQLVNTEVKAHRAEKRAQGRREG